MCTCCTPRDMEKMWQNANFRRIVYSFIWLMFSLNLRNVAQIQDYDECSKLQITQSFVETNDHHEFTSEAMKSFTPCQNDNTSKKVYYLLKRVNMHTGTIPQHILYFHLITNCYNLTLGTQFKYIFISGYMLCYSLGSNNTIVQKISIYNEQWIQSKLKKKIKHFISDNLKCNSFCNLAVIETIHKQNTNMQYTMLGKKKT